MIRKKKKGNFSTIKLQEGDKVGTIVTLTLEDGRKVIVARELTKIHEEMVTGTPEELISYFENNREKIRGEFVVIVEGR